MQEGVFFFGVGRCFESASSASSVFELGLSVWAGFEETNRNRSGIEQRSIVGFEAPNLNFEIPMCSNLFFPKAWRRVLPLGSLELFS